MSVNVVVLEQMVDVLNFLQLDIEISREIFEAWHTRIFFRNRHPSGQPISTETNLYVSGNLRAETVLTRNAIYSTEYLIYVREHYLQKDNEDFLQFSDEEIELLSEHLIEKMNK